MQYLGWVSVGAYADSGYEYMLKQWLLTGRTDTKARDLCARSPFFSCGMELIPHRSPLCRCNPRSSHVPNSVPQPPLCYRCLRGFSRNFHSFPQTRALDLLPPWRSRAWRRDATRCPTEAHVGRPRVRTDVLDALCRLAV